MRAWNLRPPNSEIFLACEYGDLPTVKKLLQSGEASIYDLSNDPRVTSALCLCPLLSLTNEQGYSRENGYSLLNVTCALLICYQTRADTCYRQRLKTAG